MTRYRLVLYVLCIFPIFIFASLGPSNLHHTTLREAILHNDYESVENLLQAGVTNDFPKENSTEEEKLPPLLLATSCGNINIVSLLLGYGFDIEISDLKGNRAIHIAAKLNNIELLKLFISQNADIEATNFSNETPLHILAQFGNYESTILLLNEDVQKEARNQYGQTPLIVSAAKGNFPSFFALLERNAYVEATDDRGNTAFSKAAKYGHVNIFNYLIQKKANLDHQDNNGLTPLMRAVYMGHFNIVKTLIFYGANLNLRTFKSLELPEPNSICPCCHLVKIPEGATALLIAKLFNQTEIEKLLLEAHASY